jgi:hypothetical protein
MTARHSTHTMHPTPPHPTPPLAGSPPPSPGHSPWPAASASVPAVPAASAACPARCQTPRTPSCWPRQSPPPTRCCGRRVLLGWGPCLCMWHLGATCWGAILDVMWDGWLRKVVDTERRCGWAGAHAIWAALLGPQARLPCGTGLPLQQPLASMQDHVEDDFLVDFTSSHTAGKQEPLFSALLGLLFWFCLVVAARPC